MVKKKALMYSNMANISAAFELKADGYCYLRGSLSCFVITIAKFKIKAPK